MEIMYWNPTDKSICAEFQLEYRTEEEKAQLIPIDAELWHDVLDKINNQGYVLDIDAETQYPVAVPAPEPTESEKAQSEIQTLKAYLSSTDWKMIKASELGVPLADVYPEDATKRTEARARINELEAVIAQQSTAT